jgi:predicted SAM-dependent methyltransferase
MRFLNLGCGQRFCTGPIWVNVDCTSDSNEVLAADLLHGIGFPDSSFDLVYHSHVLEHFPRDHGQVFLGECFRVLKPGGVLRVVVPDLECLARDYLEALDRAAAGEPNWDLNHEWMVVEMYDQTVRDRSGGAMAAWLSADPVPNADFVTKRLGSEAEQIMESARERRTSGPVQLQKHGFLGKAARKAWRILAHPNRWRYRMGRLLLGRRARLLDCAEFRQSGEIHLWMYDRVSLARRLHAVGFVKITRRTAADSFLTNWTGFNLDTKPDGSSRKPDSLYMEAVRPD